MELSTLDPWSSRHLLADARSAGKYVDGLDVEMSQSSPRSLLPARSSSVCSFERSEDLTTR
jgi:hypothetical protein